ncbi:MAG: PD-(D/E)XK nuclease family protein, partial [Selenomonadaceae bacterium]|nr:PD-(D/E)XK nuclease family protein [Selenomonadaceae bacterium]
ADRVKLNDSGFEISLGSKEGSLSEKFLTYRGLTEARERLYLSYSIADAEGKKISAASLLDKIKKIFPTVAIERVELDILQSLGSEIEFATGEKTLSAETAKKLYAPNKKMRASVTRLESFNECPFKYFSKYGLGLEERAEYKIQVPDIGNILHAVMSRFGRDLKQENRLWATVNAAELSNRVEKIIDELTPNVHNKILLSTKTLEHRRERIKKVAVESLSRLIELDKVSEFHPNIFEENFYEDKEIDDVNINLSGRIDRIDLSDDGKYFLIIDYKTGKASLSLKKIFSGLSLQLVIYLDAAKNLSEVGERDAGAMLYCLLRLSNKTGRDDKDVSIKANDDLKLHGMIRVDEAIKNAIDSTSDFVAFKKDSLVSRADLQIIIDYAEKILEQTSERILNGDIEVKPAKFSEADDACRNCVYSALCNFDEAINATLTPIDGKPAEIISAMENFNNES